jgi:hypothetical protein
MLLCRLLNPLPIVLRPINSCGKDFCFARKLLEAADFTMKTRAREMCFQHGHATVITLNLHEHLVTSLREPANNK